MNATARDMTGAPLDETIDYGSDPDTGSAGFPTMPKASPQAPFRYTYGSGARPLDGYTIKRAIGRGGFGEVYYATSDSGKEVALKLITRNVEIERRGVAQCMNLKCQNLLTIHDIRANDAGETFVVMEYVSGPSLAGVLDKYPQGMPINEVRAWLKGLVDGVDYLHDHGIVHRDLKPANLFMEDGVVKIGDYGLSKIISPQQGSEHSESIGTCHYMAPEISTGKYHKPIDIYSIGVILFEMLTGRVPFDGETVGEVLMKHLTTRPDLSSLAEPYRTIVGQALAKDPANRPKRAYELLGPDAVKERDVRFIGEGKTVPTTEPDPSAGKSGGWFWVKRTKEHDAPKVEAQAREDDVLRIGEEDPVFYIGPDTRPASPPRRRSSPPPIRWAGDVIRGVAPRPVRPIAARPVRAAARPSVSPTPPPPPVPPVEPARPTARVRIGELAASMVGSSLLVGLLAWPGAAALGLHPGPRPEEGAFLFGLTLLATWAAIVPAKLFEGSKADPASRRLVGMALGSLVGLGGAWLAEWLKIPLSPAASNVPYNDLAQTLGVGSRGLALAFVVYFALAFFANGWWKVADRDRHAKVRLWPVALSGLIAAAMAPLWPYRETWVVAVVPAVVLITQIVSPWSRPAASYAAYVRAIAKTTAKGA